MTQFSPPDLITPRFRLQSPTIGHIYGKAYPVGFSSLFFEVAKPAAKLKASLWKNCFMAFFSGLVLSFRHSLELEIFYF